MTRNVVWDVLVEHFGAPATASERSDFGKTVKEIREALVPLCPGGVDHDGFGNEQTVRREIDRRVDAMGDFRSHRSLRNRWGQLGHAAAVPDEPPQAAGDERSAAQRPCPCIQVYRTDQGEREESPPDPDCPDCGGTGIDGWVS